MMKSPFEQWYEKELKQYVTDVFCEWPFDLNWIESILYSAYEAGYDNGLDIGIDIGWDERSKDLHGIT